MPRCPRSSRSSTSCFSDRAAGLAYGEADLSAAWFSPSLSPKLNGGGAAYGYQEMRTGWTGSAGVEWMFLPKWSAKVEYLYYDLGTAMTLPLQAVYGSKGLFSNASDQSRFNGDVIRAGVNYHFSWRARRLWSANSDQRPRAVQNGAALCPRARNSRMNEGMRSCCHRPEGA